MRGLLVVVAAFLALAPAAHADVTIGSSLPEPQSIVFACTSATWSSPVIPGRETTAPFTGVITRWQIRAGGNASPSTRLVTLRRGPDPTRTGEVITRSEPIAPRANDVTTSEARLPIAAGDSLGIECSGGNGAYGRVPVTGAVADTWVPALTPGIPTPPTVSDTDVEILVNADIEPDVDGDQVGDETQDNCVGVANAGQADRDRDGRGDACDTCPDAFGPAPDGCSPAPPRVNQPPVVRFRSPASGTAVRGSQTIELDVADDAGNPTVTVFDDDGEICALSGPPYTCTWIPTGADVGRATLLASAVDSDGRSTLGIVRVRVARFEADLTRRVKGRLVTGRLVLPAAVGRSLGCRGEVTVRRGKRTKTVALKRNCTYSARVGRRGRVRARFGGNPVVEPAT